MSFISYPNNFKRFQISDFLNITKNGRHLSVPRIIDFFNTRTHNRKMSRVVRKPAFAYAKTKTQISFAVTAKLISAVVFAIRKVQSLYYLNPKFQASSHLLWLYSPVCVRPGRKPRTGFLTTRLIWFYRQKH